MALPIALARAASLIKYIPEGLERLELINRALGKTVGLVGSLGRAWYQMQDTAFKTGRALALNRDQLEGYHAELREYTMQLGLYYGKSYKEIAGFQEKYSESVGRAAIVSKENLGYMSALSNLVGNTTMMTIVDESDKLGLGIGRAAANAELMQQRAKAFGLNAQKATKTFADNIKLASKYSFRNGVDDIEKMVLKSQALRMNMDAVMQVADKFMDLDSAIETSANLSVLGGSYATAFGNPLQMAYAANADPTMLVDTIEKMVKGKVQYDAATGTSKIDPTQMKLLREAAKQLGIDIKELTTPAFAAAENEGIDREMAKAGLSLSDQDRALIENLSRGQFDEEHKEHYVKFYDKEGNEQQRRISEIDSDTLKLLKEQKMGEEELWGDVRNIRQILEGMTGRAHDTMSMKENVEGIGNAKTGLKAFFQGSFMDFLSDKINWLTSFKFADGGIVGDTSKIPHAEFGTIIPGDSYTGDKVPIMANSGEMVLNQNQQKGLFNLVSQAGTIAANSWVYGKVGNAFGMGGLGRSAMMANVISGGEADVDDVLLQHYINKSLSNFVLPNKSVSKPESVTPRLTEFDKELQRFKTKWTPEFRKFSDGIVNRFDKMGNKISGTFDKVSTRVSNSWAGKATRGAKTLTRKAYQKSSNYMSDLYRDSWIDRGVKRVTGKGGIVRNTKAAGLKVKRWAGNTGVGRFAGKVSRKTGELSKDVGKLFGKTDLGRVRSIAKAGRLSTLQAVSKGGRGLTSTVNAAKVASSASKMLKPVMSVAKFAGKAMPLVSAGLTVGASVMEGFEAKSAYDKKVADIEKSNMSLEEKAKAKDAATKEKNASYGKATGKAVGAIAGSALGFALGGPIGAMVGGWLGEKAAGWVGGKVGGLFGGNNEKNLEKRQGKSTTQKENTVGKIAGTALGLALGGPLGAIVGRKLGGMIGGSNEKGVEKRQGKPMTQKEKAAAVAQNAHEGPTIVTDSKGNLIASAGQPVNTVTPMPSVKSNYDTVAKGNGSQERFNSTLSLENTDLGLNVGGTIKLDLGGTNTQIDANKLLDSPEFRRQITDMIVRNLNENSNGGRYNMESARSNMINQYNKTGS